MKTAPKIQQKQGDYSGLSTAELLAVIAEKETRLSAQGEQLQSHEQQIQLHEQQIQIHVKTIKRHEQYIGLL